MRVRTAIALLVSGAAVACAGTDSPTHPSRASRSTADVVAAAQTVGAATYGQARVEWSCVARDSSFDGIFAGTVVHHGCRAATSITTRPETTRPTAQGSLNSCATCNAPTVPLPGPQNLTAAVVGTTVTLQWSAALVTSYVIEAGSAPGLSDLAAIDIGNPPTNPASVTFTNVPVGIYYVRVRSYLANVGLTLPSNEALVIVGNTCGVPNAPSGLSAAVTGSAVSLAWNVSATGCSPDRYIIQAGSSPGLADLANLSTGGTAPFFSTSGVGDGVYYVRVRAANGLFISSPSNEVVVTVGGACALPLPPSGLTAGVIGSSVSLTWRAPATACRLTNYIIQAGSASGLTDLANFSTGSAVTAFSAAGVATGTYYIRVRAAYDGAISGPSDEVIVRIVGLPSFAGTWIGDYRIDDCTNITPAGLMPVNICGAIQRVITYQLALSQNGTTVTGRYTFRSPLVSCPCGGDYGAFDVAGTIAPDGTLSLTGTGVPRASGLTATLTFHLSSPTPASLAGTVDGNLAFDGLLRATFTAIIVSGTRQ